MKRVLTICVVAFALALANTTMAAKWNVPEDFATIQDAIDSTDVSTGDTIRVGPGNHSGASVTKGVEIKGQGGAVIIDGPLHTSGLIQGFRLVAGSDGATISHLGFTVDLAIMNGDAINDVSVDHCTFTNTIQAVSNWRGSGWQISHNIINDLRTRNGGGIGILIADYAGGVVEDNVVSHNTITGTLHVLPDDGGGYNGSGIVIYADFRWGSAGALEIKNNRVVKNNVSLTSDTPTVVDVAAFELSDTRDDINADPYPVIFGNTIGFNDWRGTVLQEILTPLDLANHNDLSRNLGTNRGHGLHPSIFGPGGN